MSDYDHWKTTNPADNELGPEPEDVTELHQCWELMERVREVAGCRDNEATIPAVARLAAANRDMLAALKTAQVALPVLRNMMVTAGLKLGLAAADSAIAEINAAINKAEGR